MSARLKFERAKVQLLLDEPFFGTLLLNLRTIEGNEYKGQPINTMATNGQVLVWSPQFVGGLSEPEIKTVLAHEVLHCAYLHHLRRGGRDAKRWNIATDHVINNELERCNESAQGQSKGIPFPWPKLDGICRDPQYRGKSAEEVYASLGDPPSGGQGQQPGNGQGQGDPDQGMGGVFDSPGVESGDTGQDEASWKVALVQAAQAAKAQGKLPASMARLVEEMLNPPRGWREILRRFIRDRATDDYSWAQPNRRYAGSGFILPSLHSQRLGVIGIIRDTSGSTQDWQVEILAELSGIISETKPSKVIVIDADAEVQRVLELDSSDPLPSDSIGGGGTDFRPALAKVAEYDPVVVVYLTDLQGSFPDLAPSFPCIWGTDSEDRAPFGETIQIKGGGA